MPQFCPALEIGNAQQLLLSGDKYLLGFGVPKSYETAYKRYLSASPHLSEATNMLGVLSEHGLGKSKDMVGALKWYTKAAGQGSPEAFNNLGRIYEFGLSVEVDLIGSLANYEKAAENGCIDGMVNLGLTLESSGEFEKAKHWYERASDFLNARGQNCLGGLYYLGKGVEKDYGMAVEYFRKASEQVIPSSNFFSNFPIQAKNILLEFQNVFWRKHFLLPLL